MVDLALIIVLAAIIFLGWRRGALRVLASVGSLFIAFFTARFFSGVFTTFFSRFLPDFDSPGGENLVLSVVSLFVDTNTLANRILYGILFVIIFAVVTWLVRKLASFLTTLINFGIFGIVNRALGAFFAGLITLVIFYFLHGIAMPVVANMGLEIGLDYGLTVIEFFNRSKLIMPLVYALPRLVGL
ncbi:MAG: CvpA family protein [Clostridiales bacterium]|nr:CvpA family protein [Clostridiales bacterium]